MPGSDLGPNVKNCGLLNVMYSLMHNVMTLFRDAFIFSISCSTLGCC